MSNPQDEQLPAGVRALDHTADVGLEIEAPDLASLFELAARSTDALAGSAPTAGAQREGRNLALDAPDVALLLADWLRELLYLRQVQGLAFVGCAFEELSAANLRAHVDLAPPKGDAIREIKGVTYHGLEAVHRDGQWRARVIFDV